MKQFKGIEYVYIAIANAFGHDKLSWEERIEFGSKADDSMVDSADEPMLFRKALKAREDAHNKRPTGYIMSLDATASGIQIMACLMGCSKTGKQVNLINTGKREDVYEKVANHMGVDRSLVKKPVMTHYYGSKAQPKTLFDEHELVQFYESMYALMPGAEECMEALQDLWQPYTEAHSWKLPDGHHVTVPVADMVSVKVKVDDLEAFGYRTEVICPQKKGISLAANVVHSIDAWVVREMLRRADAQGFELLTIHDSFWACPNHMNKVRQNYLDILSELSKSHLLQTIARDITGVDYIRMPRMSNLMHMDMADAEYALS